MLYYYFLLDRSLLLPILMCFSARNDRYYVILNEPVPNRIPMHPNMCCTIPTILYSNILSSIRERRHTNLVP